MWAKCHVGVLMAERGVQLLTVQWFFHRCKLEHLDDNSMVFMSLMFFFLSFRKRSEGQIFLSLNWI